MNLFTYNNPVVTDADRRRLGKESITGNAKKIRLWLHEARPQASDIKRMVLIEAARPQGFRAEVVRNLLAALYRKERDNVMEKLNRKKRTRQ